MRSLQKLTSLHLCFLVFVHLLEVLSLSQIFLSPFEAEWLSNWEDARMSARGKGKQKQKTAEQQRLETFDARRYLGHSELFSPWENSKDFWGYESDRKVISAWELHKFVGAKTAAKREPIGLWWSWQPRPWSETAWLCLHFPRGGRRYVASVALI